MTRETPANKEPFNLDRVRELVELMEKHGLTEVSLKHGEQRWRLRRGPQEVYQAIPGGSYPAPMMAPPPAPAPSAASSAPAAAAPSDDNLLKIVSPTVGTFYAAPGPDEKDFVKVGSRVQTDTIVCIVEAMKVFNQIAAEVSGTIVEVLVKNGDAVEFGQPMFKVKPG